MARALGTSGTEALVGGRCGVPLGRTPHRTSRSMAAMRNANNTDGQGPGVRQRQRECPAQGWPPARGGIGVLPRFSTHFCPNYLHYSAMSAFSAPSLKGTGQAWPSVRGAGPWPLPAPAPGRGDPGCWKSQACASPPQPGRLRAPPGFRGPCLNVKGLEPHPRLSQLWDWDSGSRPAPSPFFPLSLSLWSHVCLKFIVFMN